MIEYLLIVDFGQKIILEEFFGLKKEITSKEELIKICQEHCIDDGSRYSINLEKTNQTLFAIRDKFGNYFIALTNNTTGKNGFVFELVTQIEEILNYNDLDVSKEFTNFKIEIIKLVTNYNKENKIEVIHKLLYVEQDRKTKNTMTVSDSDILEEDLSLIRGNESNFKEIIMISIISILSIFTIILMLYKYFVNHENEQIAEFNIKSNFLRI